MHKIKITICLLIIANQIALNAMEDQCSITAIPQDVIRYIAIFWTNNMISIL